MKVKKVPIHEAVGQVLLHNQAGPDGRKVLKKGQLLKETDLSMLQSLGRDHVYVAILEDNDINENEAAARLGQVIAGKGIETSSAITGRVNLIAATAGLFKVNDEALLRFNDQPGVTLAVIPTNTVVQPKTMVGTIKIIPYSVPEPVLETAETIAVRQRLVEIKPFIIRRAALITTGSQAGRNKVISSFTPALRDRLLTYQTEMIEGPYVPEDEQAISQAIQWALANEAQLILIAGETSIMDVDDITPRAIIMAGGKIVHHGAPVEPGNLLLLAYYDDIPIVGAPGCARSKRYNVVDMILARLAAGERLTRRDLTALGHGGLLK